jgi:hypothetical protein
MGSMNFAIATGAAVKTANSINWVPVLGVLLGSGVVSVLVGVVASSFLAAAETRRQGYAAAVGAVLAWAEYPYRIRRRTSDDAATLTTLANLGHDLQERRARCLAWVAGENTAVYEVFLLNMKHLDATLGPLAGDAWNTPPVTAGSGMVLSGWGAGRLPQETVERLGCVIGFRTGWRRWIVSPLPWLLRSRLKRFRPPTS